jgi:hypothetical protein
VRGWRASAAVLFRDYPAMRKKTFPSLMPLLATLAIVALGLMP